MSINLVFSSRQKSFDKQLRYSTVTKEDGINDDKLNKRYRIATHLPDPQGLVQASQILRS